MRTKKAFAIAAALLMMLAVFTIVGTTSVSAQETTVVLKKPVGGEEWSMGSYHKFAWSFPSGDQSQIISIRITNTALPFYWWYWAASSTPGAEVPTSCVVHVPNNDLFMSIGDTDVRIEVRYYSQPGVEAVATDYRTVTIVDGFPPDIWGPSEPQIFVLGADAFTSAGFMDAASGSGIDLNSVRVMVDGKPAPADKVTVYAMYPDYRMDMKTDWLSLGKHKVTVSVSDRAGNDAKVSWFIQVVSA